MQDFRNLKVWARAQHFVVEVYRLAEVIRMLNAFLQLSDEQAIMANS
jgi:hypothetical protein